MPEDDPLAATAAPGSANAPDSSATAPPDPDAMAATAAPEVSGPAGSKADAMAATAASGASGPTDPMAATAASGASGPTDAMAATAASGSTDPLGATAAGSMPAAPRVRGPTGTLGRYRLEKELGAGGMGVVHAAFDPDLERRVALKVLRGRDSDEARQRLLREARAMARLTHPNVVTVHEVASANGRDYVSMELVEGGTLEEWLRAKPRSRHEIVEAYLAAGRGLAAAHAAGLVHRDFKPHNVLRHSNGRVAVTDFGLVVGVEAAGARELPKAAKVAELSREPAETPSTTSGNTPSSLSGLTATGAVMGTPAYMAPEQWSGANVGPAADQFAFCVALWEALAGERPYRGNTVEELQRALDRGRSAIDEAKAPRRFRKLLVRGLDPDPAKRWRSLAELLDAIERAERRPRRIAAAAGVLAVAGAVAAIVFLRAPAKAGCEAPMMNPATLWSAARASALGDAQRSNANAIDADMTAWHGARIAVCKSDDAKARAAKLACLDGVLARLDLVLRSMAAAGQSRRLDASELLEDPRNCEGPSPPRLARVTSPEWQDAMAATLAASHQPGPPWLTIAGADALIARTAKEPCASAQARMLATFARSNATDRGHDFDEAERDAQRCGDDRLIADVALLSANWSLVDKMLDIEVKPRIERAEAAVEHVPQLDGELERVRALAAQRADDLDLAIKHVQHADELFASSSRVTRRIAAGLDLMLYLELRATPADVARVEPLLHELRTLAARWVPADDDLLLAIDRNLGWWMFVHGDVAAGDAKSTAAFRPRPPVDPVRIGGRVVDATGAPVAGATVAAGSFLVSDSIMIASPQGDTQTTTTGPDGSFSFAAVPRVGVAIAQSGALRSRPVAIADGATLTVTPTSQISGTVALNGKVSTSVSVMVRDLGHDLGTRYYGVRAPVQPDGTFEMSGVPIGPVIVQTFVPTATGAIVSGKQLAITAQPLAGLQLAVETSQRLVHVIVRSTTGIAVSGAQGFVTPGHAPSTTLETIMPLLASANMKWAQPIADGAPAAVTGKAEHGDLFFTAKGAPMGDASACVVGWPPDVTDARVMRQISDPKNRSKIHVVCVPVAPTDEVVVVEVPPWPRLD